MKKPPIVPNHKKAEIVAKKITYQDEEYYVIKTTLFPFGPFFNKTFRDQTLHYYSAWQIPINGMRYQSYTMCNDILLAQLGSQFIPDEEIEWQKVVVQQAIDVIYQSSKKTLAGTRKGNYIVVIGDEPESEIKNESQKFILPPKQATGRSQETSGRSQSSNPRTETRTPPEEESGNEVTGETTRSEEGIREIGIFLEEVVPAYV